LQFFQTANDGLAQLNHFMPFQNGDNVQLCYHPIFPTFPSDRSFIYAGQKRRAKKKRLHWLWKRFLKSLKNL